MAKKVSANGKTFTFDDDVTNEQIGTVIDEYFASLKKKEVSQPVLKSGGQPLSSGLEPFLPYNGSEKNATQKVVDKYRGGFDGDYYNLNSVKGGNKPAIGSSTTPSVLLSDEQKLQREQDRIAKRFETTPLNIPTEFGKVAPAMRAAKQIKETLPETPKLRRYGEIPKMQPTAMTEGQLLGESLTDGANLQELITDKFTGKKTGLQKQIQGAQDAFRTVQGDELANQAQNYIPEEETLKIKEELGFTESVSRTGRNFVNRLQQFIPNTALALGGTLQTILGEDIGSDFYAQMTKGGDIDAQRREAFARLDELKPAMEYTKGFIESGKDFDVAGLAAAVVDATSSLLSTVITSAPTAGIGLYSDMVGGGVYDYNTTKANRLGMTVEKLYEIGQNEFIVPAMLQGFAAKLEGIGLKGIKQGILANVKKGSGQRFALIAHNANKEGFTEFLQTGVDAAQSALAEGKNPLQAGEIAVSTMFSKKGAESYLMGIVASGAAIGGGRILKGIFSPKSKSKASQAIQAIEQQQQELANPNLSEESRTFIWENVQNNVAELVDAVDSDVNETEGLSTEQKQEVNNLNTKIQAFEVVVNDPAASEETKNRAKEVLKETQAKIDDIIKKKPPIVPPATGGAMVEGIKNKAKETEAKIKRKDLFSGGGEFANQLGGSGVNSVPTNHAEINGIEFVEFSNPISGEVDVVMTGTSDSDFVGFYRIYENGKPTNKWSSKFENKSRNKDNFKTMIGGVQSMLPKGHEYTEKTSISTDGLRVWNQQLGRGYELQYDNKGNLITDRVAINGDAITNELGIDVNVGNFENVSVTNGTDMAKVKAALLPYLQKFGLNETNIYFENGTVEIDLPVLKNKPQQSPTQEAQQTPAQKVEKLRAEEQAEIKAKFPDAEYKADGKIDVDKLSVSDQIDYGTIYMKYDKLITPLLPKKSTKKSIKQLESENQSTLPKIPTNKVFSNEVEQPLREDRAKVDALINAESDMDAELPTETVSVASIVPTQKNLTTTNLETVKGVEEKVILLKKGDKYFVIDGHHRIANQILNGESNVDALVYSEEQLKQKQDATKTGKIEQGNLAKREGVTEQQQREQEDRLNQKEPVSQAKAETGGGDSVVEGGKKQEVTAQENDTVSLPPRVQGGTPQNFVFSEGEWKQKVGKDLTEIGKGQQKQVSDAFVGSQAVVESPTQEAPKAEEVVKDEMAEMEEIFASLSTPPTENQGVSATSKSAINNLKTKTKDSAKVKVIELAQKLINTLQSVFPNMDIFIHDNEGSYNAAMAMEDVKGRADSGGNFSYIKQKDGSITGRIDINLNKANARTVAHEVAHAIMLKAFGENPALFKNFRDRISKVLSNSANKKLMDFAAQYEGDVTYEEYLVELTATLSEQKGKISPTILQQIADVINDIVSKLTQGKFIPFEDVRNAINNASDVLNFFNNIAESISKGEEIGLNDFNMLGVSGVVNASGVAKSKSSISAGEIKRFPTHPNTKVSEDVKLSNFNGKTLSLFESDRMTAGYISDIEGNPLYKFFGGVFYPIITGKWWASSNKMTADKIVNSANKNRESDGYIYSSPMVGSEDQHMSNKDMLFTTIEFMKSDVNNKKSKVKIGDVVDSLRKASNRAKVRESGSIIEYVINNSNNINELFNNLEFVLFQDGKTVLNNKGEEFLDTDGKPIPNFTFEARKQVVETLLGNPKVKEARFPSAGTISDVAKRFEEPITSKVGKIGDLVTVMRTKGELSTRKTDKSDPFYHKSYNHEIYAVNPDGSIAEIEVFLLDGAYSMRDIFPALTKSTGGVFTWDEYLEKHLPMGEKFAEAQYNRTAKMSSASGEVVSKSQLEKPTFKLQFASPQELVNTKDPIGNREKHNEIKERFKKLRQLIDCV